MAGAARFWLCALLLAAASCGPGSSSGGSDGSCSGDGAQDEQVPALSIILFTNRPGAWDIALHSLAQQDSTDYELLVPPARMARNGKCRARP